MDSFQRTVHGIGERSGCADRGVNKGCGHGLKFLAAHSNLQLQVQSKHALPCFDEIITGITKYKDSC